MQTVAKSSDSPPTARIAVIVPAYGVAHLAGEALASLQRQTLTDWECAVIDDGAPDDVAGAVAPFLADPRIRLLQTANHGVSAARNTAIRATRAPLVALLDGDDLLRPDYLARMAAELDRSESLELVTCNARVFGAVPHESLVVPAGIGSPEEGGACDVIGGRSKIYIGSMFRRTGWERIGGFDEAMTHSEDLDFWVRLLLGGGRFRFVNEVLGDYRVRGNSASIDSLALIRGRMRLMRKIIATKPDTPEAALAARGLAAEQRAEQVEEAIARTLAGDAAGLPRLLAVRHRFKGPVWSLSFALWRLAPWLARPMLAWRRKRHIHSIASNRSPAGAGR
ncbi:glycosyl transferase family 2 [Novosphingobium kunmingense]|uniref:Glycosyl transferase family 2 n=1 Tax=Novosphingobium kunmingense TaxID=1211806 RepID=A0A2N0H6G4_9SPHN|nr:glycosyltransferase family A protein [Novosphingobium kunmingense]PKB14543.1 glycosyl transferase family 2 [Novosphingobium kunmingense]